MNRHLTTKGRGFRTAALVTLAALCANGCTDSGQPGPAQLPPAAAIQDIQTQVAHDEDAPGTGTGTAVMAFGEGGQIKMLYDRRQRPQSVYLQDKVHIVFNAGGEAGAAPQSPTVPMAVSYDPQTRTFSDIVTLGGGSSDHHFGPVIWTDPDDYLHVLHGCHRTPCTHLVSREPASIGSDLGDWIETPEIAPGISYPTFHRIHDGKQLIWYRTFGHPSSWTYRISDDNGMSWTGPENDVTDMDIKGRTHWSAYQTTLPSRDGKFLHVVFFSYDDNRDDDPARYYNLRYDQAVSNEWKYNLYYLKVDLQTFEVTNFEGEAMDTPIDIDQADARCRIWDTEGRGAGVPPPIALDENGDPMFLHVLSEDSVTDHNYWFVRQVDGQWKKTKVTHSNHQWNSTHLKRDEDGTLHAYLVTGEGYLDTGGYMDKHGGGRIEEWTSSDKGDTWERKRDLAPDPSVYPGWKFNNPQPVVRPDGSIVDGMLLFYGWKDKDAPEARAFLLHEEPGPGQASDSMTYSVSTQADFDALKPLVFNGGDRILLERGRNFHGALSLKRSDLRPDESITVGDFGSPEAPRPVISADADGMGTIDIRDSGGWVIENLEVTNQSPVRSQRQGIFVGATDSGTHRNFVVRNCLVHDVTGVHDDFNNGGIIFRVTGNAAPTKFDGVLIENNEIRDISGVGIRTKSTWEADPDDPRGVGKPIGRHAHLNVIVRANRVSNVTRNAIVVGSADAPLLEYNVMGPNIATETTGNTLYTYATDDALVQYNEAFGNHGPAEDKDRGGFDADYNSRNTEFRYNYSHDNNFAFGIMRKYGEGIHIHHNISVNERYGFMHYGFYDDHAIKDVVVSNNTFFSTHPDMMMFMNFGPRRDPIDTSYIDNIFVFAGGGASWGSVPSAERGNIFENNIVIGLEDQDYIELTGDPLLVAPGAGGTEIDMTDPDRLGGYRLCLGSPAIGAGREGDNAARADFWGDEIERVNIGAYGGSGVDCDG